MSNCTDNSEQKNKPIAGNEAFMIAESDFPKLKKDALYGSPEAAFKLYQFYEFVQLDSKESLFWVTISAENGHVIGQYELAYALMNDSDPRNKLRAQFWLKQSAKQGNQRARELLEQFFKKKD